MTTFEELRMLDLVEKFRAQIDAVYQSGNLSGLRKAGGQLQSIYNFHLTADQSFIKIEEPLKNLYSSFNYAALICNEALKKRSLEKRSLEKDDNQLLSECVQIMLRCCDLIAASLKEEK